MSYEQSAIPTASLTPLTVDADKVAGSSEAAVPRVNPMAGDGPVQGLNAGTYRARTFVLGRGASDGFSPIPQ